MTYTFPFYVPGIAVGVSILAGVIGALLLWKRKSVALSIVALGIAAFAGGLIAPMLALDRVVLDDEMLEQTTGFWFAPTRKGFRLSDVSVITITTARDRNDRDYEVWLVTDEDGLTNEIDPGDLWEMHSDDIIRRLRDRGVDVRL